ncbi:MAG: glycosyltransferase family 2 protein [Bacteroidales bacterium]|nr:glycosyltransferase family 2 protein [Bacteroidales bacterium]
MKTAVVILNWNGRSMLERFMPSVVQCTEADVVVADNGSTDTSVSFLRETYPQVRLIELDRNYGFAGGYNLAFAQLADYDYYVLLNSDVECTPHWVEPVVGLMEQQPKVAVVQPKLLMYDRKDTFEYAGGAGGFIDSYGYPFCRGRLFSTLERDHGQYDDTRDIFWATGAAMFVRASVWRELGGLDADFFAHMEEIDFCWRVKNAGYRVMYCSDSKLYHVGGGTLPKSNPFKTQLNFRNNLSMLYKNLPDSRLRRVLAMRMMLDRVAALKFLLEGHLGEYRAVRLAHKEYRAWLPQLKAKRAAIQPHEVSQVYQSPLLVEYYLLGRSRFSQLHGTYSKVKN